MAVFKIKQIGNDTMIVASLEKDFFEALEHGDAVMENAEGKTEFVVSKKDYTELKDYCLVVDANPCIVEVKEKLEANELQNLKYVLARAEQKVEALQKETIKNFKKLKENAEKISVEVEGAENNG